MSVHGSRGAAAPGPPEAGAMSHEPFTIDNRVINTRSTAPDLGTFPRSKNHPKTIAISPESSISHLGIFKTHETSTENQDTKNA